MTTRQQFWVIPAMLGLATVMLTTISTLVLPAVPAVIGNTLIAFLIPCLGFWMIWRKGVGDGDEVSLGSNIVLFTIVSSVATATFLARGHLPFEGDEPAAWGIGTSAMAPMLAIFVPLAIGQFRLSYPNRLEYWLQPSKEARREYLRQLVKEAEQRERQAEYAWKNSVQGKHNMVARLESLDQPQSDNH